MYEVEWKSSGKRGRGVFALKNFKKGELIEECPAVPLTNKERALIGKTILEYYVYPWRGDKDGAIVLGYSMLYNHSLDPNARYYLKYGSRKIIYKALKSIKKGEEILVNYNGDPKIKDETVLFDYRRRSSRV